MKDLLIYCKRIPHQKHKETKLFLQAKVCTTYDKNKNSAMKLFSEGRQTKVILKVKVCAKGGILRNFNLDGSFDNLVYTQQFFVFFSGIRPASKSGGDCWNMDCILNNWIASGPRPLPAWKSTTPPCRCAGLPGHQLIHIGPYSRGEDHLCIQVEGRGWPAAQGSVDRKTDVAFLHRVKGSWWAEDRPT